MVEQGIRPLTFFINKRKEGLPWQRKESQRPMLEHAQMQKAGYSAAASAVTRSKWFYLFPLQARRE
jgi:hypothetical protein